jgi:hypothetical protein
MRNYQKEERKKYRFASFITNFILIGATILVASFLFESIARYM